MSAPHDLRSEEALVTKERRGREQVVHVDVTALRQAARLLDAYEQLWRHRVRGIEQTLAENQEGK